jgi:hypothetical protein
MTGIITKEACWTLLGVQPAQRSQANFENLTAAMEELGWTSTRRRVGGGNRAYAYQRGDDDRRIMVWPAMDGSPATAGYDTGIPGQG